MADSVHARLVRARAEARIARVVRSGRPIVVGPWLGEVGIELLFWIPFLRRLAERHGVERERITTISRGGAGLWYSDFAGRSLDVLDRFEPADLKRWSAERSARTGGQKQREVEADDLAVLDAFGGELPDGHALLHPSLMFAALADVWDWRSARAPLARVIDRSRWAPIGALDPVPGLPESYVAVKAYFNPVLPDRPDNRAFLTGLVRRLADSGDVVLLQTGLDLDDHPELDADVAGRVHLLEMTPADNLEVQTRAIAHARLVTGTFGGIQYLGPLTGVSSVCFYSQDDFNLTHLDLISRARRELAAAGADAGFSAVPVTAAERAAELFAAAGAGSGP